MKSCTIRTRRRLDAALRPEPPGKHRRELGVDPHPRGRGREIVIAPVARARRTHSAAYDYARTSFLYAIRCGWSASGPFRLRRSST